MEDGLDGERLEAEQRRRARREAELARTSPEEAEGAQHQRRADKADYLREKLGQRRESERDDGN